MDCKAQGQVHTVTRHGSRGPRPPPPPKPNIKHGLSTKVKGSPPPALPKTSPVARVKPMKHESADSPQASISTTTAKIPPPLPCTPPKGPATELSPKLAAKFQSNRPPSVPSNGQADGLNNRENTNVTGVSDTQLASNVVQTATLNQESSQNSSDRSSEKVCVVEPEESTGLPTAESEKPAIKSSRSPSPPVRPPAPAAKVPKPVPRKRSTTSLSGENSPQEQENPEKISPKLPSRPPVPKQRSFDVTSSSGRLASVPLLPKSSSFDVGSKNTVKEESPPTTPSRLAPSKLNFSAKLSGLLEVGPRKLNKKQEADSGDELNDSTNVENVKESTNDGDVKTEAVGEGQPAAEALKVPPRKKKKKRSRDASPNSGTDGDDKVVETSQKSAEMTERADSSHKVDQNANDIHSDNRPSSSDEPVPVVVVEDASTADDKNDGESGVQVKKLTMGFANLVTKGLQQQLTLKSRKSPSPRSRSRSGSTDDGLKTPETDEVRTGASTPTSPPAADQGQRTPPALPDRAVGDKPRSPVPPIKLPLKPPKVPAKPGASEFHETKSNSSSNVPPKIPAKPVEESDGGESRSSGDWSKNSALSSEKDSPDKGPPPPLPVRTAPKLKKDSVVDMPLTPSPTTPELPSSHGEQGKRREKRPLPPLPLPEEERAMATPRKTLGPMPRGRPLPPLPVSDDERPRPHRLAPPPPGARKRSKSSPGPVKLILEELRPRSEDVESVKKWTQNDEQKFLELQKELEELKKTKVGNEGEKTVDPSSRQSVREGRPVFKAPPPPPEAVTADRGSQTPVESIANFDFEVPGGVTVIQEEEGDDDKAWRASGVGEVVGVRKPCRPAPPPPPKPSVDVDEGELDELGYLAPKMHDSVCEKEEYSYVSSEYYPEEDEKKRTQSVISTGSQHIYEFVETSRQENVQLVSYVPVDPDNTYDVPDEVITRNKISRQESTTSHTYQKMSTPQPPPRPKRQTIRQKSLDILSIVVPVDAEGSPGDDKKEDGSDDEYIYPGAQDGTEDQNVEGDSTYDIPSNNQREAIQPQRSSEESDDSDGASDYVLPGGPLIESESTYDIASTPINSPIKLIVRRSSDSNQRHSFASSNESDSHDYFDMTGVEGSNRRTNQFDKDWSLTSSISLQLPSLSASQEALWREGRSDYSESASEEEMEDSDDERNPKKPKVYYIAREIMSSEEVFVDVLRLLNVDFRQAVSQTTAEVGRPIIPSGVFNQILHFLPQLDSFNSELLNDIRKRVENWDEDPRIADIFVRKGPFLRLYISYIRDFNQMMALFDDACKKYPVFHDLVKDFEATDRCSSLALRHYMLKPIQRIPQYKLLLQDYLNHLPEDSPDYKDATNALEIVSEVATHANESMREGDNFQKLLEIQNNLHGNFEVVKPGRTLVKMGILQKLSRKEPQLRMLFLFNDVLLYTTPIANKEYKLNHVLSLTGMKACKPTQEEFQNEFSVISIQRSFTISANTPRERDEWLVALTDAIDDNALKRSTFEQAKTNPEGMVVVDKNFQLGLQAPVWVPDARVTMCMLCTSEFTVTWRRHHCRACGRVVCGVCSDYRAPLTYLKNKPVRVCSECFQKISEHHGRESMTDENQTTDDNNKKNPRKMSESFSKKSKWGNRLHVKRPSVLKEVHANDTGSDMSGYMKVLRGKKWKKRWFVIKDKVLYTYKASEDAAASRSAPLLGYEIKTFSEYFENVEPSLVFQVSHKGTDPIIFRTESAATKDKWIQAITDATGIDYPKSMTEEATC